MLFTDILGNSSEFLVSSINPLTDFLLSSTSIVTLSGNKGHCNVAFQDGDKEITCSLNFVLKTIKDLSQEQEDSIHAIGSSLFNSTPTDGWYVDAIKTNKQEGTLPEFIEKEGKWFNYIKGVESYISETTDFGAFNIQGIGLLESISGYADVLVTDITYPDLTVPQWGNDPGMHFYFNKNDMSHALGRTNWHQDIIEIIQIRNGIEIYTGDIFLWDPYGNPIGNGRKDPTYNVLDWEIGDIVSIPLYPVCFSNV